MMELSYHTVLGMLGTLIVLIIWGSSAAAFFLAGSLLGSIQFTKR